MRGRDQRTVTRMERLRQRRFQLLDIQMLTEHTARLGAVEISRWPGFWRWWVPCHAGHIAGNGVMPRPAAWG